MTYMLIFIILLISTLIYQYIARYYHIYDHPKNRSSHKNITVRGGGIIFPVAVVLWFVFFGYNDIRPVIGLLIIALISFADDILDLSRALRLSAHFLAVFLLLTGNDIFSYPVYLWVIAFIFTIGWINIFNFMDGINGITSFYSFICLGTFLLISDSISFADQSFLIITIISVSIFGFFNARRNARMFAGDVGSVTLAYILAWMMLRLISETGRFEYLLFFSVYGIDSAISILFRLCRGENIFEAHRTHLYQYLSNELNWSHLKVAAIYAVTQLIVNIVTLLLIEYHSMNAMIFTGFLAFLTLIYLILRYSVNNRIKNYGTLKV